MPPSAWCRKGSNRHSGGESASTVMPRESGASSIPKHSWESRRRRLLDHPLEPVIGLAEGETRWRLMTANFLQHASRVVHHAPKCQALISVTRSTKVRTFADSSRDVG